MMDLQVILNALLPKRSARLPELIDRIALSRGVMASADSLARELGWRSRHQLYRTLRRAGLPAVSELTSWVRVLDWVLRYERGQETLSADALAHGFDTAVRYRLVRKLRGRPWSEVRLLGAGWVMLKLLDRCGLQAAGGSIGLPTNRDSMLTSRERVVSSW